MFTPTKPSTPTATTTKEKRPLKAADHTIWFRTYYFSFSHLDTVLRTRKFSAAKAPRQSWSGRCIQHRPSEAMSSISLWWQRLGLSLSYAAAMKDRMNGVHMMEDSRREKTLLVISTKLVWTLQHAILDSTARLGGSDYNYQKQNKNRNNNNENHPKLSALLPKLKHVFSSPLPFSIYTLLQKKLHMSDWPITSNKQLTRFGLASLFTTFRLIAAHS